MDKWVNGIVFLNLLTFCLLYILQDWTLPNEAFQLRHEILERASSPDPLGQQNGHESPPSGTEGEMNIQQVPLMDETNIREEILSLPSFTSQIPTWHFTKLVVDMLSYYAEQVRI